MMQTEPEWTIVDRERGVLYRHYEFNEYGGTATTLALRRGEEILVISPSTKADAKVFSELDCYGPVAHVVAPNGFHHLGGAQWRQQYPEARFYAPQASIKRIKKQRGAFSDYEPLSNLSALCGADFGIANVQRSRWGESYAWVRTEQGWTWYVSDLLSNWERFPGNAFSNWLWRKSGSGPGFRYFAMVQRMNLTAKRAGLRPFLAALEKRPPTLVLPSHGAPVAGAQCAEQTIALVRGAL